MRTLVAVCKLLGFLLLVVMYFTTTFPFYIWAKFDRYGARRKIVNILSFYSQATMKLLGIESRLNIDSYTNFIHSGALIISNHLSYIDILVLASRFPSCFVTSIEMKNVFFLGHICEAGGCLYVERRNKENLSNEIKDITNALTEGVSVIVFPEATSTNGEGVKRFKRPLFTAAMDSGAPIFPVSLNYKFINGKRVQADNRDTICWYDDMSFAPHFWNILKQKRIVVETTLGKSLVAEDYKDISFLAEATHKVVSSNYQPVIS